MQSNNLTILTYITLPAIYRKLFGIFLLLTCINCIAATDKTGTENNLSFNPVFYQAYESIYNFDFDKADSIISFAKQKFSAEAWPYILSTNYYWWLIISGDKDKLREYDQSLKSVLRLLDKKNKETLSHEDGKFIISQNQKAWGVLFYEPKKQILSNSYLKTM